MDLKFPKNFLFGASCSACQIEGGIDEGGMGIDCAQHYFNIYPDKYWDSDPRKNADFYHKYPQDIEMMKELGINMFRFSIAWARIYPNGPEEVCQAGLDYYSDMINKLKEAGITVFFDLWHCDLPYWVIEKGGLLNREFIKWFASYAKTCFEAFGDRVDYWCTVNEPSINVFGAYGWANNAPFLNDYDLAVKATHVMLLAHYEALKIYKNMGFKGKIGAVIHVQPIYTYTMDEKDNEAAKRRIAFYAGIWLDPMFKGHYPEILLNYNDYLQKRLPENFAEELSENFIPCDFIGLNYYSPSYAKYVKNDEFDYDIEPSKNLTKDDYGFTAYPEGLFDTLAYLSDTYPGKDIIITENGIGIKKWGNLEEEREDDYRIDYLREHLRVCARAIKAGIPVIGYSHWSIMDTSEIYAGGRQFMFGLVQVDYDSKELTRYKRKSWYYYQKVIKEGRVN